MGLDWCLTPKCFPKKFCTFCTASPKSFVLFVLLFQKVLYFSIIIIINNVFIISWFALILGGEKKPLCFPPWIVQELQVPCTPSFARLFQLGVAETTHTELNLPCVYLRGRIPHSISAVFHTVGDQPGLSKVNLAAEDQWLSCWAGVTSQVCSNANLSAAEQAPAV